jgi:hypothetical protein
VVATSDLVSAGAHLAYAHFDADQPQIAYNDPTTPARESDHDAAVGYFGIPAPTLSAQLSGSGTFGTVSVGSSSDGSVFVLTNNGEGQIAISKIATTGDFAETDNCGATLEAGDSCNINVVFTPTASGPRTGTLTVTTNTPAGIYTANLSGTGNQIAQTVTFNNPGTQVQGGTFVLSATASSGLTVTFTSKTPLVCTVSGSTASLIAPGMCTIEASQAGNAVYLAATPVDQTFSVTAVFVLTVNPSLTTSKAPGTTPVVVTLTSVNGFTGPVTLSCVLPAGLPSKAKCLGLPVTVKLAPGATVVYDTGVLFPKDTTPGSYVVTFTAIDGNFNDSTTAAININ